MENNHQCSSLQPLCKDVELGKEKNARYRSYQRGALILGLVFLMLAVCIFSLRYFCNSSPAKGITGIRFAKHQRCYIRTQTKELPSPAEVELKDAELEQVSETGDVDLQVVDSHVWIPAEKPITDRAFLINSKIWEICQDIPIHWIHPSPLTAEFHDVEDVEEVRHAPEGQTRGARQARDVMDQLPVNDYTENGLQLDSSLDDQGYCCQYCRRGYRYCRRYHEPLLGYWPYPYYYQGGRVICQIVMPCNWWIARMLGRI
uniref:Tenomodulin n=1 Tax=Astyanax mexicanus TaxID=7994 RepID=A0A3B1J6B9_ASTMX